MWQIEFKPKAAKSLRKLYPKQAKQILNWLRIRIDTGTDPRFFAESLTSNVKDLWRFRVGAFRIIFKPEEKNCLSWYLELLIAARLIKR